jgi:signal transduction histidine kinase/DNA-binding LacI/PurR family transcriptional regulator
MSSINTLFKTSHNTDITIGVVFPFFWNGNSIQLLIGIRDAAKNFGINLLTFQGYYCSRGTYYKDIDIELEQYGNVVYDLVNKDSIDGLIINTPEFKSHIDKKNILDFCAKFNPLPMISVGSKIEGIPNILINNSNSVRKIIVHLLHTHHKRKISFLRGLIDNVDSNERLHTYEEILRENDISINPDWISPPGIWNRDLAADAACRILDKTNSEIDAFVCNNDNHAYGVIEALTLRGIKVPQQVAVVGFNNEPLAKACFPAITTVDRNLYDRGWLGVKVLSDHLKGKPLIDNYTVNAPVIIRQSCGCLTCGSRALETAFKHKQTYNFDIQTSDKSLILKKIEKEVFESLNIPENEKTLHWCKEFLNSFIDGVKDNTKANFFLKFNEILHQFNQDSYELSNWHFAITVLDLSLAYLFAKAELEKSQRFLNESRILLSETALKQRKTFLILTEERNATINSMSHSFKKTNNLEQIINLLATDLPKLGIPTCYLSLYENPQQPLGYCRLLLAYNSSGRVKLPADGIRFLSSQLIPEQFIPKNRGNSFFLEPLYYGQNHLGFTLFEFATKEQSFYETFPAQLSAAIWGSILYNKVLRTETELSLQTKKLEESNEALLERAAQMETAYQQLQKNQNKLLLAEKMATLGRLTAGIAHEMNTPLATVRASISELETLLKEYTQSVNDKDVTAEDHQQIAIDILSAIDLSEKSAERASNFIKSIKAQTRDVKTREKQLFNLFQIIESVLVFLGHSLRHSNCNVQIICTNHEIVIDGSPTRMTQVFTNLITNAIDALEENKNKHIAIELLEVTGSVIIKVIDNGCGIPQENLSKIFDPMYTTKAFGQGTGLGLSIVHDIIHNDFGGSISVESESGIGTTFILQIKSV